jgi:hypothetical protein
MDRRIKPGIEAGDTVRALCEVGSQTRRKAAGTLFRVVAARDGFLFLADAETGASVLDGSPARFYEVAAAH